MCAAFVWEQPAWLIVVFAVACALGGYARLGRRRAAAAERAEDSGDTSADETQRSRHTGRRQGYTRLVGAVCFGGGAAALGALLARAGTAGALGMLGLLAVLAAGWCTLAAYRRQWAAVSPLGRVVLLSLRFLAWVLVLVLLAWPAWEWVRNVRQKPLLVVLLDESDSMSIVDYEGFDEGDRTRARVANAAVVRSRVAIERLDKLYDVRVYGVGARVAPLESWMIEPRASVSALAAGLREAGKMESRRGASPPTVLLVSDGAENVGTPQELRAAAEQLAKKGIALLAVGMGPPPGQTPLVALEPLNLPDRLGRRDRLRVPVSARVQGCARSTLTVELLWDAEPVAAERIPVDLTERYLGAEFDLVPPDAGVHRVSARVTLPAASGGQVFQTSAVVEVRDENVRVLYVEGTPRAEAAFLTRAWQADPRLELTRKFLFATAGSGAYAFEGGRVNWADYDVVILGSVPPVLSEGVLNDLVRAVRERGVGLLLAGGRRLFNDPGLDRTALAGISAVRIVDSHSGLDGPVRFVPTAAGLRHPILKGAALPVPTSQARPGLDERAVWLGLPALGGAALLGEPKPVAVVLAADAAGRPLLVAQEVGRGRCVAAGWENTWPWALASDEGAALHRRFWRQMIGWLANRRPRAWVLTDQPTYAAAALASGQQSARIRAGISGLEAAAGHVPVEDIQPRLVLLAGEQQREIQLERAGDEWTAKLSAAGGQIDLESAGEYELVFSVTGLNPAGDDGAGTPPHLPAESGALEARTRFAIDRTPIERKPPTANLELMRSAAELTAAHGGGFDRISRLPELLEQLAQTDRRRDVPEPHRYSPVEDEPGTLLAALALVLVLEWAIRKRLGLA